MIELMWLGTLEEREKRLSTSSARGSEFGVGVRVKGSLGTALEPRLVHE